MLDEGVRLFEVGVEPEEVDSVASASEGEEAEVAFGLVGGVAEQACLFGVEVLVELEPVGFLHHSSAEELVRFVDLDPADEALLKLEMELHRLRAVVHVRNNQLVPALAERHERERQLET